ncbi:MAG: enoyl-CoA hydratase/isomerase family protein [Salinisphaera sp.]|jgi:enoyl-CoA hydratase/carnithine racemase|nr:enoyl-CoA hydratase/isomerase family protein [Salinisphaera sp.]
MTEKTEISVIFEERDTGNGHCVGYARLNAERSLNALSLPMIDALLPKLEEWAARDDIACVVLSGSGAKSFCAGGDIVGLYRAIREADDGSGGEAEHYFAVEYRLDHLIHRYPKPFLCWGHGVVMGGGLGLMAGASHRVVTQSSRIAMPEVTIGLFPDVGASWFLGRMPSRIGLFLGLSTTPMFAGDALWLGLADYRLEDEQRSALFDALTTLDWHGERRYDDVLLAGVLREFEDEDSADAARADSPLFARQTTIARLAETVGVAEYQMCLTREAAADDWYAHGARAMAAGSPSSLAVVHRQLAHDAKASIEDVFRQDLAMAVQRTRQPDLVEGVRALLIDKDKNPQWQPSRLDQVDPASIDAHFRLPDDYSGHPLADL